ncbi:MAG: PAS domain S-box protein [Ardenticatenaceae bacterium]|nr:PAS domain S-box protein [Ardenticatenaceae bacterium]
MQFRALRWVTIWLPLLFIILIEVFKDFVLGPRFGQWTARLITFSFIALGAVVLSLFVFQTVERAERQLRRQNRDLGALNAISRVVSGSLELDAVLAQALEEVLEVVEAEAGEILLLDEARQELVFKLHRGLFPEAFQEITRFPVGEGFPGLVAASGELLVVTDLATDARFKRQAVVAREFRSMTSVPLRAKDRVVGVMNVACRRKANATEELGFLTAIGNQIGLAVENTRLFTRMEETVGYLNAVIESSGDAIITTDLNGHIRSWNPGAERIYGWTTEEALGQNLPMVPGHLREEAGGLLVRLRAGETIFNFETQRLHKSGRLPTVVVTASPVRDASGKIIGLAGISRDISEHKRLEAEISRQRQSLAVYEERERIAREMHDGLAQVLGYVNTKAQAVRRFLAVGKTEEAQAHLLQLEEAAREVYGDVREAILGLRTTVSSETGLIRTLEEYLRRFEQQSGIRAQLLITDRRAVEGFSPLVEVQLIRVVQESLTNVNKHAQASEVRIQFEWSDGCTRITIEDNGGGFNPDLPPRADWPQFGLQTMRERTEGIGGSLEVHSTPGAGTRICVTLPFEALKEAT